MRLNNGNGKTLSSVFWQNTPLNLPRQGKRWEVMDLWLDTHEKDRQDNTI
jgi:hypothetical protein